MDGSVFFDCYLVVLNGGDVTPGLSVREKNTKLGIGAVDLLISLFRNSRELRGKRFPCFQ